MNVRLTGTPIALAACCFGLALMPSGCATQLSSSLRAETRVQDETLKRVRYHLGCKDITLVGDIEESGVQSTVDVSRAISVRSHRRIDTVVVPQGAPGAVFEVGPNWVKVKFERDDRTDKSPRFLLFAAPVGDAYPGRASRVYEVGDYGVVASDPPDRYRLVADGWSVDRGPKPGGGTHYGWHGGVRYGRYAYDAIDESFGACLIVDANFSATQEETKRVVGGLDVTEVDKPAAEQPTPGTGTTVRAQPAFDPYAPATPPSTTAPQRKPPPPGKAPAANDSLDGELK